MLLHLRFTRGVDHYQHAAVGTEADAMNNVFRWLLDVRLRSLRPLGISNIDTVSLLGVYAASRRPSGLGKPKQLSVGARRVAILDRYVDPNACGRRKKVGCRQR